jgi:hypothetical protein
MKARGTMPVHESGRMTLGHITATRFYKSEGASFSGWVVSNEEDRFHYSDPIASKARAIEIMKAMYRETISAAKGKTP